MPAAGVVMIVAVLAIVLALVYYLVSTIVALRQIADGLDDAIAGVGEIVEKSAPVNDVVTAINGQLDAGDGLVQAVGDLPQRQDRRDEVVDEREHDQHDGDQEDDSGGGHQALRWSSMIVSSEPP